jgi:hypothetical protein
LLSFSLALKTNLKGLIVMAWFTGLSDEKIIEVLTEISNDAIVLMETEKSYKPAIEQHEKMEKMSKELIEHVSQINDIRSPLYQQRRQFIRDINNLVITTYENMVDIHQKKEK